MVLGYIPPRQALATDALWRGNEHHNLRVARVLGHPHWLALGLLHSCWVWQRTLWSLLRLGSRDLRRRQRRASIGDGFDERNGVCLPSMAASGDLAAGRCSKVPQRVYWRIDHLDTSDLHGFLDKVLTQQRNPAEGESAGDQ